MSINNNNNNPNQIKLTRRKTRCCSFCKIPGHSIISCKSDRLTEFEVICSEKVKNINSKIEFKNWLEENYNNNTTLLKAFAIKKSKVSTNDLSLYIELITEYIFSTYKNNWYLNEEEELPINNYIDNNVNENEIYIENLNDNENDNDNDIEKDLMDLLLQFRNNYSTEPIHESLLNANIERMFLLELAIAYLSNVYIYSNMDNESYNLNRKNLINCSFHINKTENLNEIKNCNICYDNKKLKNFVSLNCNHNFCENCIIKTLKINSNCIPTCALCRSEIKDITSRTLKINAKIIESI